MPSPSTVSIRKYNKELKVSADIRADLETSQDKLKTARKKNRDLRQQLAVAVAEGQEFAVWQEDLSLEKTKNIQLTKRLKALGDLEQELASCRESLQIEKKKTLELKTRLKTVSAPGERELNAVRSKSRAEFKAALNETVQEHAVEFKKMEADLRDQVKRLSESMKEQKSIVTKLNSENERLGLQLRGNVKMRGTLEHIEEDLKKTKNIHVFPGGTAGSV